MGERRRYSDEEKANALLAVQASGGDIAKAAAATGIPWSTLKEWTVGKHVTEAVTNLRDGKIEPLADLLEAFAREVLEMLPEKVKAAPAKDAALAMAIALDKMRLLREQPTSINRDETLSDQERVDEVMALFDAARAREDRGTLPGAAVN